MIMIVIALLSVVLPLVHLAVSKVPRTRARVIRLLLVYALVLDVGVIGFVLGFIPHIFFADATAKSIGWPPGNPFQFEVGFHDGGWGILGFLSLWIGGSFWIATGLGWSFFLLGATYGHVMQTAKAISRLIISSRFFRTASSPFGCFCSSSSIGAGEFGKRTAPPMDRARS